MPTVIFVVSFEFHMCEEERNVENPGGKTRLGSVKNRNVSSALFYLTSSSRFVIVFVSANTAPPRSALRSMIGASTVCKQRRVDEI